MRGQRFFVMSRGAIHAPPLFVALLFAETTDVIFAFAEKADESDSTVSLSSAFFHDSD